LDVEFSEKTLTTTTGSPLEAPDADLLEPSYMESVRRFKELADIERAHEWASHHRSLSAVFRRMADRHDAEAEAIEGSLVGVPGNFTTRERRGLT